MDETNYPALPLAGWKDTKTTLHLFTQIVGRARMGLMPHQNHWWHVPLYVSARGLTTRLIPLDRDGLEMEFDFIRHQLLVRTCGGESAELPVVATSVADMYANVRENLESLGISVKIADRPFDPSRVGSDIPYSQDRVHKTYDPEYVHRFWRILLAMSEVFELFRGQFQGKCSPVHFFWHSFDLAVTRFSGRPAPVSPDADPVTRQAYSHEVSSAGFWPGDDTFPEPAVYSYVHPEPEGLHHTKIAPAQAWWQPQNGTHLALYRYEDLRASPDFREALLQFLQTTYEAGAVLANWPRNALEVP